MRTIWIALFFTLMMSNTYSNELIQKEQFEGVCTHLARYDNYIYFNSGGTINIIDISNNNSISVINTLHHDELCVDIKIHQSTLFVATKFDGIYLYNIQSPENPVLISNIPKPVHSTEKILVSDLFLVILSYQQATIYNISSLSNPLYLHQFNYHLNPESAFAFSNDALYSFHQVGYSGPQYLEVRKIHNSNIDTVQTIQISPDWTGSIPKCMRVYNHNLFIGFNDTLKVYQVTNSDSINFLTQFSLPGNIEKINFQNDNLYAYLSDSGIININIADIYNPVETDFYQYSHQINKFEISNNLIVTALNNNGLNIVDTTNFSEVYAYDKCGYVHALKVYDNKAYIGFKEKLVVYDISDYSNPIPITTVDTLGALKRIDYNNGFLYCLDNYANVLHILSVTNNGGLSYVSSINSRYSYFSDYKFENNLLYTYEAGSHLIIYDLSLPESPVIIKENHNDLDLRFDKQDQLLATFRLIPANPPTPTLTVLQLYSVDSNYYLNLLNELVLDDYLRWFNPIKVEIIDSLIIVGTHAGVFIVTFDQQYNLALTSNYLIDHPYNTATDIVIDERHIYFSGFHILKNQLLKFDYTDPHNLILVDSLTTEINDLELSNNLLYTANNENGFSIYEAKNNTGIEDISIKNTPIWNYPNPCDNFTIINIDSFTDKYKQLHIYNLAGQIIESFDITDKKEFVLNTAHYKSGVYLYKCSNGKHTTSNCFIKE